MKSNSDYFTTSDIECIDNDEIHPSSLVFCLKWIKLVRFGPFLPSTSDVFRNWCFDPNVYPIIYNHPGLWKELIITKGFSKEPVHHMVQTAFSVLSQQTDMQSYLIETKRVLMLLSNLKDNELSNRRPGEIPSHELYSPTSINDEDGTQGRSIAEKHVERISQILSSGMKYSGGCLKQICKWLQMVVPFVNQYLTKLTVETVSTKNQTKSFEVPRQQKMRNEQQQKLLLDVYKAIMTTWTLLCKKSMFLFCYHYVSILTDSDNLIYFHSSFHTGEPRLEHLTEDEILRRKTYLERPNIKDESVQFIQKMKVDHVLARGKLIQLLSEFPFDNVNQEQDVNLLIQHPNRNSLNADEILSTLQSMSFAKQVQFWNSNIVQEQIYIMQTQPAQVAALFLEIPLAYINVSFVEFLPNFWTYWPWTIYALPGLEGDHHIPLKLEWLRMLP